MAVSKSDLSDELAGELASNLNKKFKGSGYKTAYFLEGDVDSPSNVSGWVGTGSSMLDLAISNRPGGGFPIGRITEITGLEASGKSLLAANIALDLLFSKEIEKIIISRPTVVAGQEAREVMKLNRELEKLQYQVQY